MSMREHDSSDSSMLSSSGDEEDDEGELNDQFSDSSSSTSTLRRRRRRNTNQDGNAVGRLGQEKEVCKKKSKKKKKKKKKKRRRRYKEGENSTKKRSRRGDHNTSERLSSKKKVAKKSRESPPCQLKDPPEVMVLDPSVPITPEGYPKTLDDHFIQEVLSSVKSWASTPLKNRVDDFQGRARYKVNGCTVPFDVEDSGERLLAKEGVKPPGEDNDPIDFWHAMTKTNVRIYIPCPCRLGARKNCCFPVPFNSDCWKSMLLDKEHKTPTSNDLPTEEALWRGNYMSINHLKENGLPRDALFHTTRTVRRHILEVHKNNKEHTKEMMVLPLLQKDYMGATSSYERASSQYFSMQLGMVIGINFPMHDEKDVTPHMRSAGCGKIEVGSLKGEKKKWAQFLVQSRGSWNKGLLAHIREDELRVVLDKVGMALQKDKDAGKCQLCLQETCKSQSIDGRKVPGSTAFFCSNPQCQATTCRGCIRTNHMNWVWTEEMITIAEFAQAMRCPNCRHPDILREGRFPPIKGNDDLKILVEWMKATNASLLEKKKEYKKEIGECEDLYKEFDQLVSGDLYSEDLVILMQLKANAATRLSNEIAALCEYALDLKDRLADIIDNWEGQTSREERKMIGDLLTYFLEVKNVSDTWKKEVWVPPYIRNPRNERGSRRQGESENGRAPNGSERNEEFEDRRATNGSERNDESEDRRAPNGERNETEARGQEENGSGSFHLVDGVIHID